MSRPINSPRGDPATHRRAKTFQDQQEREREAGELSRELHVHVEAPDSRGFHARFRVLGKVAMNAAEVRRLVARLKPKDPT